jgi:hypothetical protein
MYRTESDEEAQITPRLPLHAFNIIIKKQILNFLARMTYYVHLLSLSFVFLILIDAAMSFSAAAISSSVLEGS